MSHDYTGEKSVLQIWIGFSRDTEVKSLKLLCRHFRHCFATIKTPQGWVLVDPLSCFLELSIFSNDPQFDVPGYLTRQGYTVVQAYPQRLYTPAPLAFISCVGVLKRFLGIRKRLLLTPDQLFKYLTTTKGHSRWEKS